MRIFLTILILALFVTPFGFADVNDLPVRNVYDPRTRQNEPIRDYTFWELDSILDDPKFQQWNDLDRVCETMMIIYGRAGSICPQSPYPQYEPMNDYVPPHVRAYVAPYGAHVTFMSAPRRTMYLGPPAWAYPPMPPPYPRPYWR